jgi:hypothetical protein
VLECSRGLAMDEDRNFYWIKTLENYLHTDPKSGEGRFAQGGWVVIFHEDHIADHVSHVSDRLLGCQLRW